jgi:uncharacterized protein YndB with AHSA1/START domain
MLPNHHNRRSVGQTKDVGFEIGVRKTFSIPVPTAWAVLTSCEGLKLWLGEITILPLEIGANYLCEDGTKGQIRAVTHGGHIRLTWQPKDWQKTSTVQLRLISNRDKTTICFHQEKLPNAEMREIMHLHWKKTIADLAKLFSDLPVPQV